MAVIPLTLTISLCLVATFVLFFLRESAHRAFSSAEHDSLLPLADETATPAARRGRQASTTQHASGSCGCVSDGQGSAARPPCEACRKAQSRRVSAPSLAAGIRTS
ncbi:MAG: hypothetical protein JNN01_13850 [Opitutaceae bacterium]|nr:hypothetical protein [Opitutaceae bacterium]